jgi:hypothetical protein
VKWPGLAFGLCLSQRAATLKPVPLSITMAKKRYLMAKLFLRQSVPTSSSELSSLKTDGFLMLSGKLGFEGWPDFLGMISP